MVTLASFLRGLPAQNGNGGKLLEPQKPSEDQATSQDKQLEKTSLRAKKILAEEAEDRAEKTARLKEARRVRDRDSGN